MDWLDSWPRLTNKTNWTDTNSNKFRWADKRKTLSERSPAFKVLWSQNDKKQRSNKEYTFFRQNNTFSGGEQEEKRKYSNNNNFLDLRPNHQLGFREAGCKIKEGMMAKFIVAAQCTIVQLCQCVVILYCGSSAHHTQLYNVYSTIWEKSFLQRM